MMHDGAMKSDSAVRFALRSVTDVAVCFDTTATTVFAHLCHLTGGDRQRAETLLLTVFTNVARSVRANAGPVDIDEIGLVVLAHQTFLQDPHHSAGPSATLSILPPLSVTLLNLHYVAELSAATVATMFQQPGEVMGEALRSAEAAFKAAAGAHGGSLSVSREFLRTEHWLDDVTRNRVRSAINRVGHAGPATRRAPQALSRRARIGMLAVSAIVGASIVGAMAWQRNLAAHQVQPQPTSLPAVSFDTLPASSAASSAQVADGGAAPTQISWLTPGLTDYAVVVPDTIVRYSNNRVGLSWRGPCNRPAGKIMIAKFDSFTVLTLATGEFAVKTCSGGMPERWTAVVQPTISLGSGQIVPLDAAGNLVNDFSGFSEEHSADDVVGIDPPIALISSTLVDQNNDPWTYSTGCLEPQAIRYPSPSGPMYEAQLQDAATCARQLSEGHYLVGRNDRYFPHSDVDALGQPPFDCAGPRGSQTDLRGEPFAARSLADGAWSTWDGCVVRVNVIESQILSAACGWDSARIITVAATVGDQIIRAADEVTYLRDPLAVVPNVVPLRFDAALPANAVDTGLRFGAEQLWVTEPRDDAIYIVAAGGVERWPAVPGRASC